MFCTLGEWWLESHWLLVVAGQPELSHNGVLAEWWLESHWLLVVAGQPELSHNGVLAEWWLESHWLLVVAGQPELSHNGVLAEWWLESHELWVFTQLCLGGGWKAMSCGWVACWNSGWTAIPSTTWLDSQSFYIVVSASFGKIGFGFWWPQKAMAHITANKDLQTIKLSCSHMYYMMVGACKALQINQFPD